MIALLLGSFNPIHNGHIAIAEYTLSKGLADEVWFVVSPQNPLKAPDELAPFDDRLRMVEMATAHNSRLKVCDIEQSLPYPSYTVNTLRMLHERYADQQFVILAGSDIKEQLPLWREPEQVQLLADFLIYPRDEHRDNCSPEMRDAPLFDMSSTACRSAIYKQQVGDMSPEVVSYILKHELYREEFFYNRAMQAYSRGEFGAALNGFTDALEVNATHKESIAMRKITEEILAFRHSDIYNP